MDWFARWLGLDWFCAFGIREGLKKMKDNDEINRRIEERNARK